MVPVSPLMVGQMVHGQSTHKKCTVFGILAFLHILVQSNKLFTVLFAYADTDESILIDRDLVGLVLPPHSSVEWFNQVGGFIHITSLSTWAIEHNLFKEMQWIKPQQIQPMWVCLVVETVPFLPLFLPPNLPHMLPIHQTCFQFSQYQRPFKIFSKADLSHFLMKSLKLKDGSSNF